MSRTISIWYSDAQGNKARIEVGDSYLLGSQSPSMEFWSLPIHRSIGVMRLSELGVTDPVWFKGWKEINDLEQEILLLETNIDRLPYHEELKTRWIGNLRFRCDALKGSAPPESIPEFMIG